MDTYQTIISKRDVRHYSATEVTDEVLMRILLAGRMAGSAKNEEVLRLIVVRDQNVKNDLAESGDFAGWIGSAPSQSASPRRRNR